MRYTPHVVPLLARGRVLGMITCVLGEGARRYGPADVTLAEELARRAALAIDNARLYVQEIVAAHGGQIMVHSTEGQGTTFTITLPRAAGEAPTASGMPTREL